MFCSYFVLAAFLPPGESQCNSTLQDSHCSVTLGGSVYIQLMVDVSGHQLRCKKLLPSGPIVVFRVKKEKPVIQEVFRNRTEFFMNNGTLRISCVERTDSGQYVVEVFDPTGRSVKIITVELEVKGKYEEFQYESRQFYFYELSTIILFLFLLPG